MATKKLLSYYKIFVITTLLNYRLKPPLLNDGVDDLFVGDKSSPRSEVVLRVLLSLPAHAADICEIFVQFLA